jgi:ribonucleotide reductase alpha subunit
LMARNGSVMGVAGVPKEVQELFKTVWEISQKAVINQAAGRAPFIDQSQSLNLHLADPIYNKITSMHFYSW